MGILSELESFASCDWGYNAPGCVLWWLCLPDGRYHIIREYKFQYMTVEAVSQAIRAETRNLGVHRLRYVACDPAMWQKTGAGRGESIAETMLRYRIPCRKSDNSRFLGWQRVHELLRDKTDQEPWLTIDPSCRYLIRTLPAMLQAKNDPDDVDTTQDDHACDALRYGAMSRPSPTQIRVKQGFEPYTVGWWKQVEARRERDRQGVLA